MKMNYKSALNQAGAYLTAGLVATSCNPGVEPADTLDINYRPISKNISVGDYAGKLLKEGKRFEDQGMYFSEMSDWNHAAPKLKEALERYSEIVRRFPNTSYARQAEKALSEFYVDPVLQESSRGDTVLLGKNTIIITGIQPIEPTDDDVTDCVVKYAAYGPDGKRIDASPGNPFTKNGSANLRYENFTPAELVGK